MAGNSTNAGRSVTSKVIAILMTFRTGDAGSPPPSAVPAARGPVQPPRNRAEEGQQHTAGQDRGRPAGDQFAAGGQGDGGQPQRGEEVGAVEARVDPGGGQQQQGGDHARGQAQAEDGKHAITGGRTPTT